MTILSILHCSLISSVDDTLLHSPDSFDGAAGGMSLDRYHDDSMYPSSKGTLFFADCLSSKSKAHFHNQD